MILCYSCVLPAPVSYTHLIQQIPTVHLGPAAHQMEKRGVETFLGNLNRYIRAANSLMQSIRSAIRGLQRWIADLNEKKQLLLDALETAKDPTLSDLLVDYFNLRNEQRSDWSGKAKLKCTVRDFEMCIRDRIWRYKPMKLTFEEKKLLYTYGCADLELTRKRL